MEQDIYDGERAEISHRPIESLPGWLPGLILLLSAHITSVHQQLFLLAAGSSLGP